MPILDRFLRTENLQALTAGLVAGLATVPVGTPAMTKV